MPHVPTGLLVDDFENPSALAEQIRRAATDPELRARLSANARESALFYSKDRVDSLEAQLYRMVLTRSVCFAERDWGGRGCRSSSQASAHSRMTIERVHEC